MNRMYYSINLQSVPNDDVNHNLYQVWLQGSKPNSNVEVAVTRVERVLDFDRKALGLKSTKKYIPVEPGLFTKDEAIHIAHHIGRYCFNLGDMVFGYTTVDGKRNNDFFNEDT